MLNPAWRLSAFALLVALVVPVQAQDKYPAQPVHVIVPYTAGGNSDVVGRVFFEALSKILTGQFVIVNRDGAGGTIGFAQLAAARPDGYTLGFGPTSAVTNAPHLMKKLPYGFGDFEYVCQVFENVYTIAVAPGSRFKSLKELVDFARANPGKLTFGSAGVASLPHLTGEGFARETGIQIRHVPFRGDAQVVPQVLGGQIDFSLTGMGSATRSLRVLAVFSDQRNPQWPDVPTVAELGLPSMPPGFQGVYAPRGTPQAVLNALDKGCEAAINSEFFRAFAAKANHKILYLDRAAFGRRAQADYEFKGRLIRELRLELE